MRCHATNPSASPAQSRGARFESASASVAAPRAPRRLLKPQEVKEIGKHREIIFIENVKPILCAKISY